ncbi:glycosyltransferase [Flavobacterium hibisci]|uniref:glycosyltransferase n=1 Tax=Flavobacterium hibisci TaxID=1914462 RepID=UPI001CBF9711|nr:glycosyltransferase [Flavobacterium hibisci]MBZ4040821.1 glycosyltransferase [Flavobacterium hibisci]
MTNNLQEIEISSKRQSGGFETQAQYYDMIVFCHLKWQVVYDRPQHIISRMANTMKILFIEEPVNQPENDNSGNLMIINENLNVLQPNVSNINEIAAIIPAYVKNNNIAVGWFYSASFCPLLETLEFDTIIYDCMDELSSFKEDSSHLIEHEKYLMANADAIFTAGKPLYDSKKQLHHNVHYFPSCADKNHFAQALNNISIPADIGDIKGPIVGYYGTIDESVNLSLVHETAKKMPHISFVMIGKVATTDLPQEANIHYLGMKCYDELPNYLKAIDIAMMPFKLNGGRKYISNTKTLEYMAAGKPIISTKVTDIEHYSSSITLIARADEFAEAISSFVNKNDQEIMKKKYQNILTSNCWDKTVEKMQSILSVFSK